MTTSEELTAAIMKLPMGGFEVRRLETSLLLVLSDAHGKPMTVVRLSAEQASHMASLLLVGAASL